MAKSSSRSRQTKSMLQQFSQTVPQPQETCSLALKARTPLFGNAWSGR